MEILFSIGLCFCRRFTERAASNFRRSRSRLAGSATVMAVLIDGWLVSLSDKRLSLYFLWALGEYGPTYWNFKIFTTYFLFVTNMYFTKIFVSDRRISTRYLVLHQNQRASTSKSRDILRGNIHQRPNLPPDSAGPTRASRMRSANLKSCIHRRRIPDRMWPHLWQSCY